MRITGGKYRSRIVECPPGVIRPAMDRMRASLFSILNNNLEGESFLDLFSGSGCVGIEAASRGASPVHLVELDYKKKATILKNISFVEEDIRLFSTNAFTFLQKNGAGIQYDIIYADPPFPLSGKVTLAEEVAKSTLLKPDGLFIIHYPREERNLWPDQIGGLIFTDEREYGRSLLRFYRLS